MFVISIPFTIFSFQTHFTIQDLHPATWYVMQVVAFTDAGSKDTELKFATLTYTGSKYTVIFSSFFFPRLTIQLRLLRSLEVKIRN